MCNSRGTRGFITIRAILALFITLLLVPISTNILISMSKLKYDHDDISNEIGLLQLRRVLLVSYDLYNYGYNLKFLYQGIEYELQEINNRLVLSPGYQMFLDNVSDVNFYEEGNTIVIEYTHNNKTYQTPIAKTNGIYLDEFSSDYDDSDND